MISLRQQSLMKLFTKNKEKLRKKQENRLKNDLDNRQRIINIKEEEATLSAVELVEIAIQNKCSEIHIDYLKWLKSKGGKWNFAACQEKLMSIADIYPVNLTLGSSSHPPTNTTS